MKWYHQLQFIAAVPMPDDIAEAYGTTINGMWADPEKQPVEEVHQRGGRVLFSVPLIALVPKVYHDPQRRHLVDEACSDADGNTSFVPWYYWEAEPVYSICFYSETFRVYLLERCKAGIKRGMDVVNLDEINTSIGLMNRRPGGSGFCTNCLGRFRKYIQQNLANNNPEPYAELAEADDELLRQRLRENDALYDYYRHFHEREVYSVAADFIQELRAFAREHNPQFAITANLAYLGNRVMDLGDLWGTVWGEHLDLVMMENIYQPYRDDKGLIQRGHVLLPRGKFTAWYRLGSAISSNTPTWICPSIMVPRQFDGEKRVEYYSLMFVEAYANRGRWGYYWWPGVDVETRMRTTAPDELKDYIRFMTQHKAYFEEISTANEIAILYLNSSMRQRPEAHYKYVALAQALSEAGYQYDVVYGGDGMYDSDQIDADALSCYQTILIPEVGYLTDTQKDTLTQLANDQNTAFIAFVPDENDTTLSWASLQDETMLLRFWKDYQDEDRERISAYIKPYTATRIQTSPPLVNVIRYVMGDEQVLHCINYDYDETQDHVSPAKQVSVQLPWQGTKMPELRWLSLEGEQAIPCQLADGELVFEIPKVNLYGLAILK